MRLRFFAPDQARRANIFYSGVRRGNCAGRRGEARQAAVHFSNHLFFPRAETSQQTVAAQERGLTRANSRV